MVQYKDLIQRVFHETPLFKALSETQMGLVKRGMRQIRLEEDAQLFNAMEPADRFFIILRGRVKMFQLGVNGAEKVLRIMGPGDAIALALMFMEQPSYPVYATALMPCEILSFDNKTFLNILRESPETCFRVMAEMSKRMHGQLTEIHDLSMQSAPVRLTRYLLANKISGMSSACAAVVRLDASKRVIASRISIQPETFSRILARLIKLNLIEVKGRVIHLLDLAALQVFAEEESGQERN
ncbi:MAG: Crp/Fnr family transcriptional regulator [Magnetococcales bacterium]|nr:Crp/Fnr family transcriptional regulator [Magnetococcales bacterium]MBF0438694.1 Crp/Fnr family transcriptional regulator [Magnetococcales bacterium]